MRRTTSATISARAVRVAALVLGAGLAVGVSGPAASAADWTPTNNPGVTVWQHGGSNMGECSAFLATLDVPGVGNVRASVNHTIKQYGDALGISSPGALYSVRAKQQVNLAPAAECLPRQLPGGGTG